MNIILIGPPACGKGTQAKLIAEKFGVIHVSTGDMFRKIVTEKGELADKIRALIDNGKFVPDELTIKLLKSNLKKMDLTKGILLDGFPRTVYQAQELDKMLNIDYIFEIVVSKEVLISRVVDRASCEKCGKSYILSKHPSPICDDCGGKIIQRQDDTREIAESRFDTYVQKTYPIIDYYKKSNGYHQIDGEKSVSEVFDQICEAMKK